ncbi:helicase [Seminavis robusta]|uniref:Helicase n=1 Tax=Seminavis robusta TaxID=568900 RepID=A0A9N8E0D2_9STRA|nr:helicase [Seminavis robusta]|eukprot:Sro493_g154160.1 helicase (481) ;mRNA; f:47511-48953
MQLARQWARLKMCPAALAFRRSFYGTFATPMPATLQGKYCHSNRCEVNVFSIDRQICSAVHLIAFRSMSTSGGTDKDKDKDKDDLKWRTVFGKLEEYKTRHGDTLVPQNYPESKELGVWVNTQRMKMKNALLRSDRKAKLDELGFVWDPLEHTWEAQYDALVKYKENHGNSLVPREYPENKELGTWVDTQRQKQKNDTLRSDRKAKLDELGFVWDVQENFWDAQYDAIVEYKEAHGDTIVPTDYPENRKLGSWVDTQRQKQKNGVLRPDRKERLDGIGFVWDALEHTWEAQYDALVKYKEEHGDTLVPRDNPENKELGFWVDNQRRNMKNGTLRARPDRKAKLEDLGFIWDPYEHFWEAQYDALVKCKEKHGDTRVPRDDPENKELGFWVNEQRRQKKNGSLLSHRKAKLDELGFVWDFDDIHEEAWLEKYEQLKWCYANPGVVFDSALRAWTILQCRLHAKGSLAPHRKALLDEIGFEW